MHTRDEIMAMDAAQLRLAIAEAIEPKPVYVPNIALVLFEPQWSEKGAWFCTSIYSHGDVPTWLPRNYTGDISAAWELVEEMIANDRKFHLLRFGYLPSGSQKKHEQKITWEVCYGEQDVNLLEYARGETAPLAIARAWLMWKEGAK